MINDKITIYIASISNTIYAISEDKKEVKYYMKYIRRLNKDEYDIDKKEMSFINNNNSDYERYIIERFYDILLPRIDIDIILSEESFDTAIKDLLKLTYRFSNILEHSKDYDVSSKNGIKFFKDIKNVYKHRDTRERLERDYYLSNPIISANIQDYNKMKREYIRTMNELIDMNTRYSYLLDKEDYIMS